MHKGYKLCEGVFLPGRNLVHHGNHKRPLKIPPGSNACGEFLAKPFCPCPVSRQIEYITFIDDDDWAEPDFLGFLLNLAEENQADVAIPPKFPASANYDWWSRRSCCPHGGKMYT